MNKLFLVLTIVLIDICCTKENSESSLNELLGTWVEKKPELYDKISDTIVFTENSVVEKHFYFKGYNYKQKNDSIIFFNSTIKKSYSFEFLSNDEIVINNFLDRSITSEIKNIHFLKEN